MKLIINNVSKSYGKKEALKNITLKIEAGIIGLLGPNGAGKSTLMRLIATIDQPTAGTITYDGLDTGDNPEVIRSNLGYLPQDFGVYPNMTAEEFLLYMAAMKGIARQSAKKRVNELMGALNLTKAGKTLLGGYSGGMKQRVGIAQALLSDPSIIIVDEPTVGLDPEERIRFRNLLTGLSENKIIILSTHIVSDVESIAPLIAILAGGRLSGVDTPENLMKAAEGAVWKSIVPASQLAELEGKYSISNTFPQSDGVHIRIISRSKPAVTVTGEVPTLEDAYLFHTAQTGAER